MLLSVIRHGITDYNAAGLLQGQSDIDLNEDGWKQAQLVGQFLSDIPIDAIYSSDLLRALHTAECIVKAKTEKQSNHCDLEIQIDLLLRERNFGVDEGTASSEMREKYIKTGGYHNYVPEGGESIQQVLERAKMFFDRLSVPPMRRSLHQFDLSLSDNAFISEDPMDVVQSQLKILAQKLPHIVLVSHGGFIRCLVNVCKAFFHAKAAKLSATLSVNNCSITTFVLQFKNPPKLCTTCLTRNEGRESPKPNVSSVTPILCNFDAHLLEAP